MAGVKGKSGRRSNANEALRLRVLDKAWVILDKAFDDPDVPAHEKRELAAKLAVKSIPTELAGEIGANLSAMGNIVKTVGNVVTKMEFNIGGNPNAPEDTEHTGEAPAGDNEV